MFGTFVIFVLIVGGALIASALLNAGIRSDRIENKIGASLVILSLVLMGALLGKFF